MFIVRIPNFKEDMQWIMVSETGQKNSQWNTDPSLIGVKEEMFRPLLPQTGMLSITWICEWASAVGSLLIYVTGLHVCVHLTRGT